MKIFLETHNLSNRFTGFGQFNFNLLKAMSKCDLTGLEITISTVRSKDLKAELGNIFNYSTYKSITRYKFFRPRKKYDLWHSVNQNIKTEPRHNLPYLLTVHDVNFIEEKSGKQLADLKKRFEQKLNRSNAIVYISKFAKEMTHKYFTVPKVPELIIYNGSPEMPKLPEAFQPQTIPQKPFLFTIGGLIPKKNFHVLIEMMNYLPDYSLVIAGKESTPYATEVKELIKKYKLGDRIYLPGKISEDDKYYYYENCSAFVFPSLREGFGIPPIEAMKKGKPVIAANSSSIPEVCGSHAFYWDHFEASYMSDLVKKALEQYALNQESLSQNYKEHADSYSWKKAAEQYLDLYRSFS